jgi:hypothetical protein
VELMRNLINRAKQPGHLYPMAMFSYPVMPPPKTVDKALGERRLTAWSGVGISVCEELDWQAVIKGEAWGRCTGDRWPDMRCCASCEDSASMCSLASSWVWQVYAAMLAVIRSAS